MYKTLFGILAGTVLLHFLGLPAIINAFVDLTLANPSVAESVGAPIIKLVTFLLVFGIPALMAYYAVKDR